MEILVLYIFFSCILLLPSSPSPASAATIFNDASALLQFKKSSVSADPNGFLNNWKSNNSTPPSSRNGVFYPPSGGPVCGLNLSRMNLDVLMSLSTLRHLDLAHNNFSLELSTFDFSGCGTVNVLDISSNRLTAGLPSSLANCSNLQRLNLSNNQLTGGIPAELAQTCSTLTELDLSANKLTSCSSLHSTGPTGFQRDRVVFNNSFNRKFRYLGPSPC